MKGQFSSILEGKTKLELIQVDSYGASFGYLIKYLPVEEGEAGAKGTGEGSITYTLPSK